MILAVYHLRRSSPWFIAAWCLLVGTTGIVAQEKAGKGSIRISPRELFTGELARVYPHLVDLAGFGCVKVDFEGSKTLAFQLEIWQDGKAKPSGLFKSSPFQAGEISFSVRERVKHGKGEYKITIIGRGAYSFYFDIPTVKEKSSFTKGLDKTITVAEGSTVAIWALNAGKGSHHFKGEESFEETARRVEWALVLKIGVEKKQ